MRILKASNKTTGIGGQLLKVFVLQMLFISAITLLGVYIAAKVVEGVMMRAALEGEAEHFWKLHTTNSDQPLPNTDNLRGYLAPANDLQTVPVELRSLPAGFGRVEINLSRPLVFVQDRYELRLFLVFDEESVTGLSFYFGVVPLSLALIILYISAWLAYRQSRKAISPIIKLARQMSSFDMESQNIEDLKLDEMQRQPGSSEAAILIDALTRFTDEIKKLISRERQFTRHASHELRTPLAIIQGSAEWLKEHSRPEEKQQAAISRILRTVNNMNELVNALLLLARGAKQNLRIEECNLKEVVRKVISEIQLAHGDNETLFDLESDTGLSFSGSPEGVYMVTSNLLRNAYSYTDESRVSVRIDGLELQVQNKSQARQKGDIDELFEPFIRGKESSNTQGYGVGLDIVKRLCDHFGWTIDAHYEPEIGVVFTVRFSETPIPE